jgi:hypothetical protein
MTDPLAPTIHRDTYVQLQFAHLKRGCVVMPHKVSDQTTVLVHQPGPCSVGDTRGLDDGCVGAHVVDDSHEAIVEHLEGLPKDFVECKNAWAL